MLVALLTVSVLLSIAVNFMQWRLPNQPRLGLLWTRRVRRFSPRAELAIELSIVAAACVVLPLVAIGLTVLLIVVASNID
jgi:hypothetical protein